ncbi:MAG: ribosome small subunit-dependent GTPase A [Balneolaceae bacterium]
MSKTRERGQILETSGSWVRVRLLSSDEEIQARLRGRFRLDERTSTQPATIGDRVEWTRNDDGTGTIEKILPRDNYLPRKATHGRQGEQLLVANVDRAWVVVSIRSPRLKEGFIDRFLVLCEAHDVPAGILVNKMDLANERERRQVASMISVYESLGYPVLATEAVRPETVKKIESALPEGISVFIGPSGVGKSTLLNVLNASFERKTADVSSSSSKGKHTTTTAVLLPLGNGQWIADTPGIRELGLVGVDPAELSLYFPEMAHRRSDCKYYNCTHSHEPGCAVMQALEDGKIDPERYHSYLQMLDSITDSGHNA